MQLHSFYIEELFSGKNGDTDIKKEHINGKGYPVITSGLENNGVLGNTDITARVFPENTITVDMFGNAFYRDFEYKVVTHARVFSLLPKNFNLTEKTGLYVVTTLKWLAKHFSYNNMCNYEKIKSFSIQLPVFSISDSSHQYTVNVIDWQFMQDRIAELDAYLKATCLDDYELTEEDKKVLSLSLENQHLSKQMLWKMIAKMGR